MARKSSNKTFDLFPQPPKKFRLMTQKAAFEGQKPRKATIEALIRGISDLHGVGNVESLIDLEETLALFPRLPEEPTFTLFPQLPKELQLMIWEVAAKDRKPQMVTLSDFGRQLPYLVTERPQHFITAELTKPYEKYKTSYSDGIPALLHTTQDSRAVAMKTLTLRFGAFDGKPKFFDYKVDTLCLQFCKPGFILRLPEIEPDLSVVQKLRVHQARADTFDEGILTVVKTVEDLTIVRPGWARHKGLRCLARRSWKEHVEPGQLPTGREIAPGLPGITIIHVPTLVGRAGFVFD